LANYLALVPQSPYASTVFINYYLPYTTPRMDIISYFTTFVKENLRLDHKKVIQERKNHKNYKKSCMDAFFT
jgi:hypothetical protein